MSSPGSEGLRFTGGAPDGPATTIDGDNDVAPGPMLTLLLAAAACSGSDVVVILEKMRVKLRQLRIEVSRGKAGAGTSALYGHPSRLSLGGEGLDPAKATRAIDLSLEKYCSVIHSLAPDIAITYALALG